MVRGQKRRKEEKCLHVRACWAGRRHSGVLEKIICVCERSTYFKYFIILWWSLIHHCSSGVNDAFRYSAALDVDWLYWFQCEYSV